MYHEFKHTDVDAPIFSVLGDEVFIHTAHEFGWTTYVDNASANRAAQEYLHAGYHQVDIETFENLYPTCWVWPKGFTSLYAMTPRTIAKAITGLMLK